MRARDRKLAAWLIGTVSGAAVLVPHFGLANPAGPNVVSGDVSFNAPDPSTLVVTTATDRSIINWDSFSIGLGELTRFDQPSAASAVLNRVVGADPSSIYGTLASNGQVYLINPNGIVVGPTGRIEVGGFVASTLDVSDAEFLAGGDMVFKGVEIDGGIRVHGKIRSVSGGDIFLLSREVDIEEGAEISTVGGTVGIAGGEEILLRPTDSGDGRISIRAGKGRVDMKGAIEAAAVEIAAAGGNEYAVAVNSTGVIRATGAAKVGGRVMLSGGGTVKAGGTITAKKVRVVSKKKIVASAKIDASDAAGTGGEVVFEAPDIVIEAASLVDVSGLLGGGTIHVGGGYQGKDGSIVNARDVTVESGARLVADATGAGDGGEVVVWADGSTNFAGFISARGGAEGGDGGLAEVSGKEYLAYEGLADLRAVAGSKGTLLLDPAAIVVSDFEAIGAGIDDGNIGDGVLDNADNLAASVISDKAIRDQLALSDVSLQSDTTVTFSSGVDIEWVGATLFEVVALTDITAADNVRIQNTQMYVDNGPAGFDASDIYVQQSVGGVSFNAGREIKVGGPAAVTGGGVAIGSEFGRNDFVAIGAVSVLGSHTPLIDGYAQIGYQVGGERAGDSGLDYVDPTSVGLGYADYNASIGNVRHAANGTINVTAGGIVTVQSGSAGVATGDFGVDLTSINFAQIGHGGRPHDNFLGDNTINVAEITGDINVTAGAAVVVQGPLDAHGDVTEYAQIGHGTLLINEGSGLKLAQGAISGDINIDAVGLVSVNAAPMAPNLVDGMRDFSRAQIGHGGTGVIVGGDTAEGVDYTHGAIQGDIVVTSGAGVMLGSVEVDSTVVFLDPFSVEAQIGHGAHGYHLAGMNAAGLPSPTVETVEYLESPTTSGDIGLFITDESGNFLDAAGAVTTNPDDAVEYDPALEAALASSATDAPILDADDNPIMLADSDPDSGVTAYVLVAGGGTGTAALNEAVETASGDIVVAVNDGSGGFDHFEDAEGNTLTAGEVTFNADLNVIDDADGNHFYFDATGTQVAGATDILVAAAAGSARWDVSGLGRSDIVAVEEMQAPDISAFGFDVAVTGDGAVDFVYGDIAPFVDVAGRVMTSDITLSGQLGLPIAAITLNAAESLESGALFTSDMVDNYERTQIGHGSMTAVGAMLSLPVPVTTSGDALDVSVVEGRIAGDIDIDTLSLMLNAAINSNPQRPAETFDYMSVRIGHATADMITTYSGGEGLDGGSVSIDQADILDAQIDISAAAIAITNIVSTPAQTGLMTGNTVFTQIGHSGDLLIRTGGGGLGAAGIDAGNGGDVTIVKGTVWDGYVNAGGTAYYGGVNSTDIRLTGGALTLTTTDTVGAQAASTSNLVHAGVGHGHRALVATGNGGLALLGNSGGRAGDILVTQGTDARDFDNFVLEVQTSLAAETTDNIGEFFYGSSGNAYRVYRQRLADSGDDNFGGAATAANTTTDIALIGTVNPDSGEVYRYYDDSVAQRYHDSGPGTRYDDSLGQASTNDLYEIHLFEPSHEYASLDLGAGTHNYFRQRIPVEFALTDPATTTTDIALIGQLIPGSTTERYTFFDDQRGNYYQVPLVLVDDAVDLSGFDATAEDMASGLRGDIVLDLAAISVLSNVTTGAQAVGDHESAYAVIGHGDYAEFYSGHGGAGGTASAAAETAQVEAHGGRGGHIDIALNDMLIEGDIVSDPTVAGAIAVTATILHPAQGTLNFSISEANIGHGERIFAHAGDGAAGGSSDYLADDLTSYRAAQALDAFMPDFQSDASGHGAATGGNGGDIRVALGAITDRRITDRYDASGFHHDDEADIILNKSLATTVSAILTPGYQATGNSEDIYAGIGHRHRLYGEGGIGAIGGTTRNSFDDVLNDGHVAILPDVSGGRGGDVLLSSGNIIGDIVIDGGPVTVTTLPTAANGGFQKVISTIGHTTDLIAVSQAGGASGSLTGDAASGGIVELDESNASISGVYLLDGNGDDEFDLAGVNDACVEGSSPCVLDTAREETNERADFANQREDGVDIAFANYNGGERDGVAETFETLDTYLGSNPTIGGQVHENGDGVSGVSTVVTGNYNDALIEPGQSDDVIFHDYEGDPEYILVPIDDYGQAYTDVDGSGTVTAGDVNVYGDVMGTFARNYSGVADPDQATVDVTYQSALADYRNDSINTTRFGRVVEQYDADIAHKFDVARYVDLDQNGTVDLVDFDGDHRFDIVDIDKDGRYDMIDGRADYVASRVIGGETVTYQFGILDYTAVTGLDPDLPTGGDPLGGKLEGGWTLRNEVTTANLFGVSGINGADAVARTVVEEGDAATIDAYRQSTFTRYQSDLSNANGGRGGDAYVHAGFTQGDIAIDAAGALMVTSGATEEPIEHVPGLFDVAVAQIGHGGYHWADSGANYALRSSGRAETGLLLQHVPDIVIPVGHIPAIGGIGGVGATDAQGGRGGDSWVLEGQARDVDPNPLATAYETDYLVGSVLINVQDYPTEGNLTANPNLSSHSGDDPTGYDADGTSYQDYDAGKPDDNGQLARSDAFAEYVTDRYAYRTADAHDRDGLRIGVDHLELLSVGVTITSAGVITGTNTTVIAKIGHGGLTYATPGLYTGNVTDLRHSTGILTTNFGGSAAGGTEVVEIADGGRGGDGSIETHMMKGETRVDTAAALTVTSVLSAAPRFISGIDTILSQIGHGQIAVATGGVAGAGGSGEWSGNGGRGGDATIVSDGTLDAEVELNVLGAILVSSTHAPGVSTTGTNNIISSRIGHGDWSFAESGIGGAGDPAALSSEQGNQTANGGRGGDVAIEQGGYNGDIRISVLGGLSVTALETPGVTAILPGSFNIATIGHGGQAIGISHPGGVGGLLAASVSGNDRNLVTKVDFDNEMFLGSDRSGGRGGNVSVNIGVGGTGRVTGERGVDNDYGVTDNDGSDIHIQVLGILNVAASVAQANAEIPDVLADPLGAPVRTIDGTMAVIGHTGEARANATLALGGLATASGASEANGGDGGDAIATTGFVQGDIVIDAGGLVNVGAPTGDTATLPGGALFNATAESRIGHLMEAEALGGSGGSTIGSGTISARGGDSGNAIATQDRIWGDIDIEALGIVTVIANDSNPLPASSPTIVSGIGHRMDVKAIAGLIAGANGSIDQTAESLYFTYEALYEFKQRVAAAQTAGQSFADALETGFDGLSNFEQKLVAPFFSSAAYKANVSDKSAYFDDKGIAAFFAKLMVGERDDNFVEDTGAIGYEYAAFDGNDHVDGGLPGGASNDAGNDAGAGDGFNNVYVGVAGFDAADEVLDPDQSTDNISRADDRTYLGAYDPNADAAGSHAGWQTGSGDDTGRDYDDVPYETTEWNRQLVGNQVNDQSTRYEIGALTGEEVDTLVALMSQSGDGGHAVTIQGGYGAGAVEASGPAFLDNQDMPSGIGADNVLRSVAGEIHIEAAAVVVQASALGVAVTDPLGFQSASIGHQAAVYQVKAGDGALALNQGIAGDGGDAGVIQEAFEGNIEIIADSILVSSTYAGAAADKNQLTRIGHRLNIGHDYEKLRPGAGVESVAYVVRAGDGGSGPYAGNGGNVIVDQQGVVSTWNDYDGDGIPDSADVDVLNNGDQDGDGIDDSVDITYVGGLYVANDTRYGDSAGDSVGARGAAGSDGIKDSFNDTDGDFNDADGDGIEDLADVDLIGGGDVDGDGVSDYADVRFDYGMPAGPWGPGNTASNAGGSDRNGYIDESSRGSYGGDGIIDAFNDTDGYFNDIDGDGIEDSADVDVLKNGDHDLDGIDDIADVDFRGYIHNDREAEGSVEVNGDTLLVLELRRWAADPNDVADPADAYTDANGYRHDGDPTTGLFIDHNGNGVFDYAVDEQVFETVTGDINASALTGAVLDRDEVDLGAPNRITGTIASLGLTEQTGGVGSEDVEIVNLAAVTDDDGVFHVMYDGTSGKFYAVQYDTVVQSDGTTRTYMIRGAEYSDPRIIAELTQYEMVVVGDGVADADQTRAMTVALNLTTGINDDSGITTDTASTVAGYDLNRGRFEITALEARYDNNIVDRYETVPTANRDGAVAGADGQGSRLFLINDSDPVAGYTGTGTAIDPRNAQYDVTSAGWIGLLPDTADADFRFNGDADGADNIDNVADVDFTASIDATPVADTFTGITGITAGNDAPARADGARPIRNNIVLWSEGLTGTLTINSLSTTGLGTNETETLVGHSMVVVSARAGDAGIGALGGLDEGVVEGNGGDVAIAQGDLGGDITAYAENLLTVNSTAITGLGLNYTYTRIGHERTIGLDADRHDDLTPGSKLLDEGSIVAGNGGTTDAEDYNTTAEAEGLATTSAHTVLGRLVAGRNVGAFADTTDVEDGDGGNVLITHGVLKGSDNLGNRESVILARNPDAGGFDTDIAIALDSHGAVLINTTGTLAGTGAAYSRITIGLQQHAVATAGDAGAGTAGDGGNVIVSRGAISGDIVAQALNGGAVTVANTPIAGVGAAFSDIQIGHESTFGYELEAINPLGLFATVTSGDGGAGADRYASVRDALVAFLLDEDNTESTNNDGQIEYVAGRVTLTDASKVVADIDNAYRMVEAANKLADRYAPEDQTRLANALAAIGAARTAAHAALENAGTTTLTLDEQVDAVQTAARTTLDAFAFMSATASDAASPIDGTTFTQADLDKIFGVTGFTDDRNDAYTAIEDLTNGEDRGNDGLVAATSAFYAENASKQLGDHADGGDIVYTSANALRDAVPAATIADEGKIAGNVRLVSGIDNESLHFNTAVDPNSGDPIQNLYGDNDALEATNDGSTAGDMLRAAGGTHVDRADYLLGTQDDYSSGLVSITSVATAAAAAAEADTEIGHRRLMWNASGAAGGDAGEGGAISVANVTEGNVVVMADSTVIESDAVVPIGGTYAELHFLHDEEMLNEAGAAIVGSRLGDGGDILASQTVTGGFTLATNGLGVDQTFGAGLTGTGSRAVLQAGHQVDGINLGASQVGTDSANRGGDVSVRQTVAGASATDGTDDIVTFDMDLDEDGNARDLSIQSFSVTGLLPYETIVGSTAEQYGVSGFYTYLPDVRELTTPNLVVTLDDGNDVTAIQTVSGDLEFDVEDLAILGNGPLLTSSVQVGNTGTNVAESGLVGSNADYGGLVTANQTIGGDLNVGTLQSLLVAQVLPTNLGTVHVGHIGVQTARSADDDKTAGDDVEQAPGKRTTDVAATQLVEADLSVTAGDIVVQNNGLGDVWFGHEAFQTLGTEDEGFILATSDINPNTDLVLTTVDPASLPAAVDGTVFGAGLGDLSIRTLLAGEAQIGHRSTSAIDANVTGSVDTAQRIGNPNGGAGDVIATVFNDLAIQDLLGGTAQLGHYVTEAGPVAAATGSIARQLVDSDIVANIGDNLEVGSTAGVAQIGHRSPETNVGQAIGNEVITRQTLAGAITVEVGTDAGGAITGAIDGDDDALIQALAGTARIGHNHADTNGMQVSSGDIWLRVRSDLYVNGGAVGHEHYNASTTTPDSLVRNRITGRTTIGAGQNSPAEDTDLTADVAKFENATINSGYAEVGGQLRFFMPAQQNLTIAGAVTFNDSDVGDPVTARTADASNVFAGTGGISHEHYFELMSTTAAYSLQGAANFTFYFEPAPQQTRQVDVTPILTPYLHSTDPDRRQVYRVSFVDGSGRRQVVRTNFGRNVIGTSSFDIECEEQFGEEQCRVVGYSYEPDRDGNGSQYGFLGSGGNGGYGIVETEYNLDGYRDVPGVPGRQAATGGGQPTPDGRQAALETGRPGAVPGGPIVVAQPIERSSGIANVSFGQQSEPQVTVVAPESDSSEPGVIKVSETAEPTTAGLASGSYHVGARDEGELENRLASQFGTVLASAAGTGNPTR